MILSTPAVACPIVVQLCRHMSRDLDFTDIMNILKMVIFIQKNDDSIFIELLAELENMSFSHRWPAVN